MEEMYDPDIFSVDPDLTDISTDHTSTAETTVYDIQIPDPT